MMMMVATKLTLGAGVTNRKQALRGSNHSWNPGADAICVTLITYANACKRKQAQNMLSSCHSMLSGRARMQIEFQGGERGERARCLRILAR